MLKNFMSIVAAIVVMAFPDSVTAKELTVADFRLNGVELQQDSYQGNGAFRLTMPRSAWQDPRKEKPTDRDFMAWLPLDFGNGVIEVDIASDVAPDAPTFARGFAGLAFRIDPRGKFESIYLRPTNAVADDQIRRNHSVQYVAYPDFQFDRLRKESPEKYESYADIDTSRWIHMKVEVRGSSAKLYLDHNSRPALLVSDLKLGPDQKGGVGVWLETGSIVHFRNLRVRQASRP